MLTFMNAWAAAQGVWEEESNNEGCLWGRLQWSAHKKGWEASYDAFTWMLLVICSALLFFSTNGWLGFPCIEWVKESRMRFLQGKPYFWQRWFLMCVHMHVHFFHNWLQRCGRIKGSRFNSTQVNNLNLIMKICLFLWISSSYYMSFSVPWP